MADWYHPPCFFDAMMRTKATTVVPESVDDIKGWELLQPEDEALLQPQLDEFLTHRKAKLNGTLPKKPKAPKASATSAMNIDAPSPWIAAPKTPSKPKTAAPDFFSASPAASLKPKIIDKFGLRDILDKRWHPILAPLIEALPNIDKLLSTFSQFLPDRSKLFQALEDLDPAKTKLIILKDKPFMNAKSASGYALHDTSAPNLAANSNPQLLAFLTAVRSHCNAQGNVVDWQTYSTRKPIAWFEAMKHQGVLMMNSQLSADPGTVQPNTSWDAVVLKIIKTIFSERKAAKAGGVVLVLCGENLEQMKRCIQRIHARFADAVPIRIVALPSPDSAEFATAGNPIETIDAYLLETENTPPNWFPEELPPKAVKSAPAAGSSTASSGSYPSKPKNGKMTSRVQLTSMDGKADLDVGKFHRSGPPGTFLMRSIDIDASDPTLSSHLARFELSGPKITITPLATNPIFHCSAGGNPSRPAASVPFEIKRGDLISFSAENHTYRVDPYNFANPPTNRYQIESSKSANTSFMDLEDAPERAQDAKRIAENEADHLFSAALPVTKKTKKPAAMDWIDDDEDEDGLEGGDTEWKPSKHGGESAYDHIIDDGEVGSSDDEGIPVGDVRPMCKYGAACYRKNTDHLAQFRHPPKNGAF
jgi:uracil DNA glycosylase